ncbi:hypothetical protein ACFQ0D_19420, partial [Micromonospora zhanjiangensis]
DRSGRTTKRARQDEPDETLGRRWSDEPEPTVERRRRSEAAEVAEDAAWSRGQAGARKRAWSDDADQPDDYPWPRRAESSEDTAEAAGSPWRVAADGHDRQARDEGPDIEVDQFESTATRLTARWVSDAPVESGRGGSAEVNRWRRRAAGDGPSDRFTDTGQWERPPGAFADEEPSPAPPSRAPRSAAPARDPYGETGQFDRFTDTGQFDRFTDTGQWDRFTDTGQWDRLAETTGQWDRLTDTTEWSRAPVSGGGRRDLDGPGYDDDGEGETFWSGTRLAGDDPRWMDTPISAPRSPAVSFPNPARVRPASGAGRRGAVEPDWRRSDPISARRSVSARRSAAPPPQGRGRTRRIEEDLLPGDRGGYSATLLYTAVWYAVPVLALFVWLVTLDGSVAPNCVTDIAGGGCESPRLHALRSLLGGAPQFGAAFAASLVMATLMRRVISTWRARSIGLAAAVIGGGLSTVVFSALSNQPLN